MLSAFGVIDPAGNNINASTFSSGSFAITNTSQIGQQIDRVHLDLRSAIFPDIVYDPFGAAGDPVGKPLTIDKAGGTGFSSFNYLLPHDGGFDTLEMFFTDFDPGETVTFSIDNDPTSIRGLPALGPNESGSISGIELIGATLTVDFNDSTSLTGEYYWNRISLDGSRAFVEAGLPAQPSIQILGIPSTPTTVSNPIQTVRVSGPQDATVLLLVVEGALFVTGGGFDLDPFEANTAITGSEQTAIIGSVGFVDIPITLTNSNPDGGLNHIVAVIKDGSGKTGPLSTVKILGFSGTETIQFSQSMPYQDVEGAGSSAVVTLTRTGDTSGTSQVQVNVTGGSATAGADYDGSSFPLLVAFGVGVTTQSVPVTILQDTEQEVIEDITFAVTAVSGVSIGSNSTVTLQILDDDDTPTKLIHINAAVASDTDAQRARLAARLVLYRREHLSDGKETQTP